MINPEENGESLPESKASRVSDRIASAVHGRLRSAALRGASMETRPRMPAIEGDVRAGVSGERVAEVRRRIRNGAYNTVEVAHQVALRLVRSGELNSSDE